MEGLKKFREEIDDIDNKIIQLLSDRFKIVEKVGKYKKENGIMPLQNSRWQEILDIKKEQAINLGLEANFIEKVWNSFHDYALNLENNI